MSYYDENAQAFIDNTLNIDMAELYSKFIEKLPAKGMILDIGCGPGRDLNYFYKNGFRAIGLEPSEELASFARKYSNCEVIGTTIQNFESNQLFDGIWACASLLHLESSILIESFKKVSGMMNDNSVFYCSFKLGDFEGYRNGRFFNDQTLESISKILPLELKISEHWITEDLRPDRNEQWLNLIIRSS